MTPSGVFVPGASAAPQPVLDIRPHRAAFDRIEPYLCFNEFGLGEATPIQLLSYIRGFALEPTLGLLAALAADVANRGVKSQRVRALTTGALVAQQHSVRPWAQQIGDWVKRNDHRVIAHERVLAWLQAIAILECGIDGPEPSHADLAWLIIVANDLLDRPAGHATDKLERTLAMFARESRYNVGGDPLSGFVRADALLSHRPETGPLASKEAWNQLHQRAFAGRSFRDYLVEVLGALIVQSMVWGTPTRERSTVQLPVVDPGRWQAEMNLAPGAAHEVIEPIAITIASARAELIQARASGALPPSEPAFVGRPFLRLDENRYLARSPWLLREQMRLGAWDRMRRASRELHGNDEWNRTFGQVFELWARDVAVRTHAAAKPTWAVEVSEKIGDMDELEDVVLRADTRVALISAKSRLMPGDLATATADPAVAVGWYDSLLFFEGDRAHRRGALRLLDDRVRRIREGRAHVASRSRIYPVLLTFERLGDSPILHQWVAKRCGETGILQQDDVARPTFLSASEYEHLLAAGATGVDPFAILERRSSQDEGLTTFQSALMSFVDPDKPLRVPGTQAAFDLLMNEMTTRLFGKPFVPASTNAPVDDDD